MEQQKIHQRERLFYIDNLRLMMIMFVIMHHLAVTYSGYGSWYYNESKPLDTLSTIWFAFYLSFQQGYFMGFLFLIAGFFVAGSYDRKGFGRFVGDRFKRLVIPSLIYMIVITSFIGYVELGQKPANFSVVGFLSGTGVMWFAVALFIFSFIYGLVRLIFRCTSPAFNGKQIKPTFKNAVILVLIISICAFLIRIVQPIGTDVLNMQLCYFAGYIILFIVGIFAYRNNLFAKISYKSGKRWLICGIVLGFLVWLTLVIIVTKNGNTTAIDGGFTWQSAAFSVWESFVVVAMCIGLIGVFREKFNHQSKLIKKMSDSAFAVYMFHPPIIVAVALLFSPVAFLPIVKWILLCVICVPLCFAAAYFIFRKIPLLKNVL
jgi:fucose 4-O-acetylase-like acetyltransferase